ncbi:MAG TPA: hypothetical protein DEO57_07905, partial [Phycisphaerales bacterium]|nr:hypothetical protein [Phycisphaerales bacterium]
MKFQAQRPLASILLLTFAGLSLICLNTTVLAQADEPPADTAPKQDTAAEESDSNGDTVSKAEQLEAKVNASNLAAQRLAAEGRWRDAANKFAETLKLMPDDEQARDGYQQAMNMLNQGSMLEAGSGVGMASVEQQLREQRQRATVEFDSAYQDAMD